MGRLWGHDDVDQRTRLGEMPCDVNHFVTRNAARNTEHNTFARKNIQVYYPRPAKHCSKETNRRQRPYEDWFNS